MLVTILSALARGVWAIEPEHAQSYIPLIQAVFNGDQATIKAFEGDNEAPIHPSSVALDANLHLSESFSDYDEAPQGSIAIIQLTGPMMKRDSSFRDGTATIARQFKIADAHPNIDAIIQVADTPGGHVDGTQTLSNTIKNTKKPVVTFVDGLLASAGYWAASGSNEIIASSNTDMIGSIGTLIMLQDLRPFFEKQGVKFHLINATGSEDKGKALAEALDGKYDRMKSEILDPSNKEFLKNVKENRGKNLAEEVLTGGMYYSEEALRLHLIDGIGTFEHAVSRATELGIEHKQSSEQTPNSKFKILVS